MRLSIFFRFTMVLVAAEVLSVHSQILSAQSEMATERNVVYGLVDGAALLMDVHKPKESNQLGILFIPGSGFGSPYPKDYDQPTLRSDADFDTAYTSKWVHGLVDLGYTVFVIDHRFAPKFKYNDIIADCRRAVRYIRFHAEEYGINGERLGAFGHSSGGNLAAMLGVSDAEKLGDRGVEAQSSKVQAVVTLAAPFDLSQVNNPLDTLQVHDFMLTVMLDYMGELPEFSWPSFKLSGKYAEVSPISHLTPDDAPILMYNSDNDPVIAAREMISMHEAMKKVGLPTEMYLKNGEEHSPVPDMKVVDGWFKKYLKK